MSYYTPDATAMIGAYSVPRCYEVLEQAEEDGSLSRADRANAQFIARQAAILAPGTAGMNQLPCDGAFGRLEAMVMAKQILRPASAAGEGIVSGPALG